MAKSIEQTMSERYAELNAGEETGDENEAVLEHPDDVEAAEVDEGAETTEDDSGSEARARDEKGRFAPKTKDSATQDVAESVAEPPTTDTVTAQPVDPPASWSADDKALFSKLPQDVQATLARREKEREADYTRKTQAIAPLSDLDRRYGTYAGQMRLTTAQLADQLLQTHYALATGTPAQKQQVLKQIAAGFGIEVPAAQPQGSAQQQTQLPADPAMQAVAQVQQDVQATRSWIQQMLEDAEIQRNQASIDAFRDAKNADGTPKHPHFATLENEILLVVRGARAQGQPITLDQAYEQAVWLNPTTRAATINAEKEKAAKAASAAATNPAKKRAAAANMPKAPTGPTAKPGKGKTIEETMHLTLAANGYGQND